MAVDVTFITKDPTEVVKYSINWTGTLPTYDYISTSTWAVSGGSGLTVGTTSFTEPYTYVTLSAGTSGVAYTLKNTIVTSKGLTLIKTASLTVTSK